MGENACYDEGNHDTQVRRCYSHFWIRLLIATVCLGVLFFAARFSLAAELKNQDLTNLSLEDLYNLDVMQINVLGGHTHPQGQIMFGYQYMFMDMEGIKKGEREISVDEAMQEFPTVHTKMTMEMHMFDLMYAPIDRLTVMAMLPYKRMGMHHEMTGGTHFTQHADGIGDLEVMGLYTLLGDVKKGQNRLILDAGISFPTGSIDVRDHRMGDPTLPLVRLEYPMQLGSGTYDLLPGLTYLGEANK